MSSGEGGPEAPVRRWPAAFPLLHLVTDDAVLAREDFESAAAGLLASGGPRLALHVRGPQTSGRTLFRRTEALLRAAEGTGARVVVNDRVDVALACRATAVQLGRRSLPAHVARALVGSEVAVGVSTHDDAEAAEAAACGADWVFAGTIHPTPSHPGVPGRGAEAIASALSAMAPRAVPVVAIGGITPERIAAVRAVGAAGIAVIRGVWDADDPREALTGYLVAWEEAR